MGVRNAYKSAPAGSRMHRRLVYIILGVDDHAGRLKSSGRCSGSRHRGITKRGWRLLLHEHHAMVDVGANVTCRRAPIEPVTFSRRPSLGVYSLGYRYIQTAQYLHAVEEHLISKLWRMQMSRACVVRLYTLTSVLLRSYVRIILPKCFGPESSKACSRYPSYSR
jgi:hypothetical protein